MVVLHFQGFNVITLLLIKWCQYCEVSAGVKPYFLINYCNMNHRSSLWPAFSAWPFLDLQLRKAGTESTMASESQASETVVFFLG